jgi:hypothetical protein
MDWQQFVSLVIVGVAGALLVASRFRRKRFSWSRDTHCGCAGNMSVFSRNSIVFHARKGSAREIVIKM